MKLPKHIQCRPTAQQVLWAECRHRLGGYTPFEPEGESSSIIAKFDVAAELYGERTAVNCDGREVSYAELALLSRQYAQSMRSRLSTDDSRKTIALMLPNDLTMIACMLAVSRLGKVYLPLDPTYPEHRLEWILDDAKVSLLVVEGTIEGTTFGQSERIWQVDKPSSINGVPAGQFPTVSTDALSYILYTSGSTGTPKGVVQSHRGQLMDVANWINDLQLGCHDRLVLLTAYTQLGNQVIFSSLLSGACVFPLDFKRSGISSLDAWLEENGITILRSTSTFFRNLAHTLPEKQALPSLRLIRLGGEPVYKSDFELYQQKMPDSALLCNALATTETGTISSILLDKNTEVNEARVSVGFAVEGTTVSIMDDQGQSLENGADGEIVVHSRFCAQGYWQRESLMEQSFGCIDGGRVFRTGDVGVLGEDSELAHLGRKDFQIKIRGYRVEPAEIEAELASVAGVRSAAVKLIDQENPGKGLVAYLIANEPTQQVSESLLVDVMQSAFPDYMRPRLHCWLDEFPLTDNGKTDYRNLPKVEPVVSEMPSRETASLSEIERKVYNIWKVVLDLEHIDVNKDFISHSGTSLQAMHVIRQVLDEFGTDLPIKALFESATVISMAKLVVETTGDRKQERRNSRDDILAQLGLSAEELQIPGRLAEVVGGLPVDLVDQLLQSMAQHD